MTSGIKPGILFGRMGEKAYLLGLLHSGLLPRYLKALLEAFGSGEAIWSAPREMLAATPGIPKTAAEKLASFRSRFSVEEAWETLEKSGSRTLGIHEPDYPVPLKSIADPPPLLFYRGDLACLRKPALAVVGSRSATPYGLLQARKLSETLSACGFTIVSGLARGIDRAAHQGALEGGTTAAVLGSSLDRIYPPENENLARRIAEQGVLLSEFPHGTPPLAWNFPRRNRIISGLSLGIVVAEAGEKSGALITARFALEQGREVFALPGNPDRETSRGTHRLIEEGAKLVQEIRDILEEFPYLSLQLPSAQIPEALEGQILGAFQNKKEGILIDHLVYQTRIPVHDLAGALFVMETKGLVARLPGNIYVRI